METRCALVDVTGAVVNVIIADPQTYPTPAGFTLRVSAVAGPGDKFVGDVLATKPAPVPPTPPTTDQIYDAVLQTERGFKALVLALNDGSFVPGSNRTGPQLKAILKAKM